VIAVHASGGRAIKQWPVSRFAEVATQVARAEGALLLLTGTSGDRAIVEAMSAAVPPDVPRLDLAGEIDLPLLAATLERCHLLITGDTGPMHLAAFVGTPIVAIFGPSDPIRYAPLAAPHRVVRIDLPCAPCNRIRLPPARCQGHTPDCLEGVTVDAVLEAARALLASTVAPKAPTADIASTVVPAVPAADTASTKASETPAAGSASTHAPEAPTAGTTSTDAPETPAGAGTASTGAPEVPAADTASTDALEIPAAGTASTDASEAPTADTASTDAPADAGTAGAAGAAGAAAASSGAASAPSRSVS
jgi:hypothetical protein